MEAIIVGVMRLCAFEKCFSVIKLTDVGQSLCCAELQSWISGEAIGGLGVSVSVFFFKQKTAYEIGLGIPAEPLFRSNTISFTVFPEIVPSIGNSFINTMKNINHTRSSISDDIRNILCSSANMRRAIPLILRLLMN